MLTQCPECKTKFRVNDDQLRAAQGQVRCSRCHIIFNAREFLQNPSTKEGEQTPATAPDSVTDFISDADLEEFSDLKAQVSNDLCPFEDSDSETLPKQPGRKIDEDLSEVLRELERHQAKDRKQSTSDSNSTDQ
ncbi:MAG: zinc-ribbon domain-containing protein, partial [Gammaproteobacteria bacterium]